MLNISFYLLHVTYSLFMISVVAIVDMSIVSYLSLMLELKHEAPARKKL